MNDKQRLEKTWRLYQELCVLWGKDSISMSIHHDKIIRASQGWDKEWLHDDETGEPTSQMLRKTLNGYNGITIFMPVQETP